MPPAPLRGFVVDPAPSLHFTAETSDVFLGRSKGVVYTVPTGYRLSVEFFGVGGTKYAADTVVGASLQTELDGATVTHEMFQFLQDDFDQFGSFADSKVVQVFADPETEVRVFVTGDGASAIAAWEATIAGRLEPLESN